MNKSLLNLVIVFLAVLILVMVYFTTTTNKHPETYIEYTNSIYKVSWQCIRDHYVDDLTEDGKVFSIYSINPDCEATYLGDFSDKIYGNETPRELHEQAKNIYNELLRLDGNATFFDSAIRKSTDTGEVIKDMTEIVRRDNLKEVEQPPEENYERNFDFSPKSKSVSV